MSQVKNKPILIFVAVLCLIALALITEIIFEGDALADPPDSLSESDVMRFMGEEDLSIMKFVEGDFEALGVSQETVFEARLINPATGNVIALVPGEFSLAGPQYIYVGEFNPSFDPKDSHTLFYELDGATLVNIDELLPLLSESMFLSHPLTMVDILGTFPVADDAFGNAVITQLPRGNYKVLELDHPTVDSYEVLYLSDNEPSDGSIELDGTWGKSVDIFNTFILMDEESEPGPSVDPDLDRDPEPPPAEEEPESEQEPPLQPAPTQPKPPSKKKQPNPAQPKTPNFAPENKQSATSRQTARTMPQTGDLMSLGFWGFLTVIATAAAVPALKSFKNEEGESDD